MTSVKVASQPPEQTPLNCLTSGCELIGQSPGEVTADSEELFKLEPLSVVTLNLILFCIIDLRMFYAF